MRRWLACMMMLLWAAAPCPMPAEEASPRPAGAAQQPCSPGPRLSEQMTVDGITIGYPKGLDSQAQQVAEVCRAVMVPRRQNLLALERAFSDSKRTARALTQMLGCPEDEEAVAQVVSVAGQAMSVIAESMLTDVRVYRESDLKAAGVVCEGAVSLSYLPETDRFDFRVETRVSASEASGRQTPPDGGFYPVIVKEDGTFRCWTDLSADMAEMADSLVISGALQGHFGSAMTAAGAVLTTRYGHPFTQWFVAGSIHWLTPRVVQEIAPEYAELCWEMYRLERPAPEARARVNLLAWPLDEEPRPGDARDEESHYCAAELMHRLLRDRPPDTLAAITGRLKGQHCPDTDAILQALDATLGGDSRRVLLEYVPETVRTGLQEGRPAKLREEGYRALAEGDTLRALKPLSDALEMTPSDADMRVNLAVAMRREGHFPKWASERQIRLAAALARCQPDRELDPIREADHETAYVLGRIAQLRGRAEEARDILSKLPSGHADAQEALREIATAGEKDASEPSPPAGQPGDGLLAEAEERLEAAEAFPAARGAPLRSDLLELAKVIEAAIPSAPARAHIALGRCRMLLGEYRQATDSFARALTAGPDAVAQAGRSDAGRLLALAEAALPLLPAGSTAVHVKLLPADRSERWLVLSAKTASEAWSSDVFFRNTRLTLFGMTPGGLRSIWQSEELHDPAGFSGANDLRLYLLAEARPRVAVEQIAYGAGWTPSHLTAFAWREGELVKALDVSSVEPVWIPDLDSDGTHEIETFSQIGSGLATAYLVLWPSVYACDGDGYVLANERFPKEFARIGEGIRQRLQEHPGNWELLKYLGICCEIEGDPEAALDAYRRAEAALTSQGANSRSAQSELTGIRARIQRLCR